MARRCTVCDHPERMAIELEIAGDKLPNRIIASHYGLTQRSLLRHKANHLKPSVRRRFQKRANADTDTLIDSVMGLISEVKSILESAEDPDLKLRAIDRLNRGLDLRGRVTGEIAPPQVQTFVLSLGMTEEALRKLAEQHKALESGTWEDDERNCVAGLRLILDEHPERAGPIREELFGDVQVEEG